MKRQAFGPPPLSVPGWARLGKHQATSVVTTVVDFGVMILMVSGLGLSAVVGTVIGASAGAVFNFLVGRFWVFGAHRQGWLAQALAYGAVSFGSLCLNAAGEYALHNRLGANYVIARAFVAVAVSLLWNYPMQSRVVFRTKP